MLRPKYGGKLNPTALTAPNEVRKRLYYRLLGRSPVGLGGRLKLLMLSRIETGRLGQERGNLCEAY